MPAHFDPIVAATDAATVTINAGLGDAHSVVLGGNRTLAVANIVPGQAITLILQQDATGSRTATWFAGITWANAAAPTLKTAANARDVVEIRCLAAGSYLGTVRAGLALADLDARYAGGGTVFVASGASHAQGIVPDPGASAGTTRFLREDATWAVPAGGSVFVASGASHAAGLVPDPGVTAGTARYLREDATWTTPSASIAVGGAVSGGAASKLLAEDASQNLATGPGWNGSILDLGTTGVLKFNTSCTIAQSGNGFVITNAAADLVDIIFNTSPTGTNLRYENRSGQLLDAGLPELQFGATNGALVTPIKVNRDRTRFAARVSTAVPVTILAGVGTPTANQTEWYAADGTTVLGTVSENGYFTTRKNSAPADAEIAAGEAAFWLDSTNGAGKFMVKAKTANGTVVTGSITLT
jgi:hypothetical protein